MVEAALPKSAAGPRLLLIPVNLDRDEALQALCEMDEESLGELEIFSENPGLLLEFLLKASNSRPVTRLIFALCNLDLFLFLGAVINQIHAEPRLKSLQIDFALTHDAHSPTELRSRLKTLVRHVQAEGESDEEFDNRRMREVNRHHAN